MLNHSTGKRTTGKRRSILALAVLASMCASLVSAVPAFAQDQVAAAATDTAPADVAQANPFSDVPANSWAYDAVRQLSANGYLQGYPDGTFKGGREITRYEMAVIINRVVNAVQAKLAQGGDVKASDLAAVRKLVDGFSGELKAVQARVAKLEAAQAAMEKSSASMTAALNKATADQKSTASSVDALAKKLKDDEAAIAGFASTAQAVAFDQNTMQFWARDGVAWNDMEATNGPTVVKVKSIAGSSASVTQSWQPGVQFPAGIGQTLTGPTLAFGSGNGTTAQSSMETGPFAHGAGWQDFRFQFKGTMSPNFRWQARLESQNKYSIGPSGLPGTTPGYLTSTSTSTTYPTVSAPTGENTGATQDAFSNVSIRVAYAQIGWVNPNSGLYAWAGRVGQDMGRWMTGGVALAGGQQDGVRLGYTNKNWDMYVMPEFGTTSLNNGGGSACFVPEVTGGTINAATGGVGTGASAATTTYAPTGLPGCVQNTSHGIAAKIDFNPTGKNDFDIGATYSNWAGVNNLEWNGKAGLCVAGTAPASWNTYTSYSTLNSSIACAATATTQAVVATGQPNAGAPVTGAYQSVNTSINAPSIYAVAYLGPRNGRLFRVDYELMQRLGNDPLTGSKWTENRTEFFEAAYASKSNWAGGPIDPGTGIAGSNVVMFQYWNSGLNGLSVDAGLTGGSAPFYGGGGFLIPQSSGMQQWNIAVERWFTPNVRAGFDYLRAQMAAGMTGLPAGGTTCPGCVINKVDIRSIMSDVKFVF